MNDTTESVLKYLIEQPLSSSKELHDGLNGVIGYATVKRVLNKLSAEQLISTEGKGKATKYLLSPSYELLYPIDLNEYFKKEQDERQIKNSFNFILITGVLSNVKLFTVDEEHHLEALHAKFKDNISHLSTAAYNKEMERLAIDLSWKSSQIEGNTYSLLETERLLKEKETAEGKPKDDAVMLLNHKDAINFIVEHPDYVIPLNIRGIEDIHSLLIKDLGVDRNIRQRRVGISGTNYTPLDNEHQIREALNDMCVLVNSRENIFEKSMLTLVLLSYIQAFGDGNKRTARIVSNAILIAYGYCPISFRTVDSIEYKKAMLLFYEQNNISAFKKIFIDQFEFAVKTYF
ncbi:Fic family protein [Mucilaginibacter sp.]|uniref:Fic family protein n=1 Tax=Mucilaginibacter sp. TaxID=1882438 RepID=UPI00284DD8FC|nr:Fic family protein [Mucilaginibacter sp.]MDR3693375.1 Fic family protein [Mucilaginibacter sp.]